MWVAFQDLAANLGFSFEGIIFYTLVIGGLIFYARDFKIGAIMHFLISLLCFMWFFYLGWDYSAPLKFGFAMLVLMALGLYSTISVSRDSGGFV